MTRWIVLDSLGPFPNLTKLNLSGVTIRKKNPLKSLCNLKQLVLTRVTISEHHLDLHEVMPNLEVLVFDDFDFENGAKFVEFDKLRKLKTLDLSRYCNIVKFQFVRFIFCNNYVFIK